MGPQAAGELNSILTVNVTAALRMLPASDPGLAWGSTPIGHLFSVASKPLLQFFAAAALQRADSVESNTLLRIAPSAAIVHCTAGWLLPCFPANCVGVVVPACLQHRSYKESLHVFLLFAFYDRL